MSPSRTKICWVSFNVRPRQWPICTARPRRGGCYLHAPSTSRRRERSMTINITPLINGGYLVEGTDSAGREGTTGLPSERWEMVTHLRNHEVAQEQFDDVVKEFFAPLTDAADKAKALLAG